MHTLSDGLVYAIWVPFMVGCVGLYLLIRLLRADWGIDGRPARWRLFWADGEPVSYQLRKLERGLYLCTSPSFMPFEVADRREAEATLTHLLREGY